MKRVLKKTCLLILSGIVYTCFLQSPTAFSQVLGTVRDTNGTGVANVRITVANGFTTCSDSKGRYSLNITPASSISVTCTKQGYKRGKISLNSSAMTGTMPDISLLKNTPQRELRGYIGAKQEGVSVKLYKKERGGFHPVLPPDDGVAVTCADGMYSFSELADGVYKIAPECSICTFSPAFIDNVQIPCNATATFDFKAGCTPGACQ
jgi:hypothetical protein